MQSYLTEIWWHMALNGQFRLGDKVSVPIKGGAYATGVVVSAVGWRECVLTMAEDDAILFTNQVKAKVGDAGVAKYQKVAVVLDASGAFYWHDNHLLRHTSTMVGSNEQAEVSGVEGAGGSDGGAHPRGTGGAGSEA
jgi:hypothetical protein